MTRPAARPQRLPCLLALGDSYTIGESVDASERWPAHLARKLRARGIALDDPAIVARTGWTTDELQTAIDAADVEPPYELVTLLIGVNDQYRGRAPAQYRDQFRALLRRAIGFADDDPSRVIVLSIPDWSVTPFAAGRDRARIAAEIDELSAINREEAERARARYVDVTTASRRAADDPQFIAADGLHPSAGAYEEWARLVLPAALEVLGQG